MTEKELTIKAGEDMDARLAEAKKTGFRIFQNLNGNAVAVHAQLLQRSRDGQIDALSGCSDKLFH